MKVNTRLTHIIELLAEKKTASEIARELKISRVAVHKTIQRLLDDDLIQLSPESTANMKFYIVNHILTMSEKGLTQGSYHMVFDPHNYALKFKLVPNGEGSFPKNHKVSKRNWNAFYLQRNMVDFELTTKHLLGSLGDRIKFKIEKSSDVNAIKSMIHSIIIQEAVKVVKEFNMQVDLNHPIISREELGIVDPQIEPNDLRIRSKRFDKVYRDKIEFRNEHDLKSFIDSRVMDNTSGDLKEMVNEVQQELRGSLSTLNAIANTQNMIVALFKARSKPNRSGETRRKGHKRTLRSWLW